MAAASATSSGLRGAERGVTKSEERKKWRGWRVAFLFSSASRPFEARSHSPLPPYRMGRTRHRVRGGVVVRDDTAVSACSDEVAPMGCGAGPPKRLEGDGRGGSRPPVAPVPDGTMLLGPVPLPPGRAAAATGGGGVRRRASSGGHGRLVVRSSWRTAAARTVDGPGPAQACEAGRIVTVDEGERAEEEREHARTRAGLFKRV